jgi:hypothetical protein
MLVEVIYTVIDLEHRVNCNNPKGWEQVFIYGIAITLPINTSSHLKVSSVSWFPCTAWIDKHRGSL